jgi:translocation and assembly module TamB
MRRILKISLIAVGTIIVLLGAAFGALQSGWGKQRLADYLSTSLSEPGASVSFGELRGLVPWTFDVANLEIGDVNGPYLQIAHLTFDLDVGAALFERFRVHNAVASGVRFLRLPVEDPANRDRAGESPIPVWPSELSLEDFRVTDLWIAPEVAGRPATLKASGRIVPDAGAGEDIVIDIASDPEQGLRATVFLRHDHNEDRMRLAAEISEPADGIVARVLDLPLDAPLLVHVIGEGPAQSWQGDVYAVCGAAEWSGNIVIESRDQTRITVDGQANLLPFVDAEYRPLLGPELQIRAVADILDGNVVEIAEATVKGATSFLSARGRLDLAAWHADLTFDGEIPDLAPYTQLVDEQMIGALRFSGRLNGALDAPEIDAQTDLRAPALQGYAADRIALALKGRLNFADLPTSAAFVGTGNVTGLTGVPEAASGLLGSDFELAFDLQGGLNGPVDFNSFAVEGQNLSAVGAGTIDLETEDAQTRLSFHLPQGAPLAAALGLDPDLGIDVTGPIDGTARGAFNLAQQSGRLGAALTLDGLDFANEIARVLAGPRLDLETSLTLEESGAIILDRVNLRGAGARLAFSGTVESDLTTQNGRLQAEVFDLAVLSDALGMPLKGTLGADTTLTGSLAAPRVEGEASTRALDLDGLAFDRFEATFSLLDPAGTANGEISAEIEMPGAPRFSIRSHYSLADGEWLSLPDVRVKTDTGNSLAAELRIGLSDGKADGRAELSVARLEEIGALVDFDLAGEATAGLEFSAGDGRQDAAITLEARNLASTSGPAISQLNASGKLRDLFGSPTFSARIDAEDALGDGFQIDSGRAEVAGDPNRVDFEAELTGALDLPTRLALAGEASRSHDAVALRLDRLEGNVGEIPLALRHTLLARLGPGQALQADGVLDVGGGEVALAVAVDAETNVKISVNALPLDLTKHWLPLRGAGGVVDADLLVTGPANATSGSLHVIAKDLQLALGSDVSEAPPVVLSLSSAWSGGKMKADAELTGLPGTTATISAALPFNLSLAPFGSSLSLLDPLTARLDIEGDLAQLSPLLPLGEDRFFGFLNAEIDVSGTLDAPSFKGRTEVAEGRYENFDADTVIDDLNLVLRLDGRELRIENLAATDGDAGKLIGEGVLALDSAEAEGGPANIVLRLDQFFLLRRDDIVAPFTGELTARREAEKVVVLGALASHPVEIRIPERLPSSTIDLDPTEVNNAAAGASREAPTGSASEQPVSLGFNVDLSFPRQLFVRGRGLDSEWRGTINLGGNAEAPRVSGKLELVRGRFEFVDKTFDLKSGNILFDGSDPPDPEINIVAEADAGDILARVTIAGRASALELAFESDPALPRDEILAYILFEKGKNEISPFQAAQLARTAASLSGSGGPDIVGQVREVLSVDDVSVVTEGDGPSGAALSVGKYVIDGVYLRAQQGIAAQSTKASVEVELTDSLTVESDIGADAHASTWINWQFKY